MKKNTVKLRTEGGKWFVEEAHKISIFESAREAWRYILLLKEIRPLPPIRPRQLYPVRSLIPTIGSVKKIVHTRL